MNDYLLNIFNEMDMTIALALNSHPNEPSQVATNVGRFKWQLDNYIDMTGSNEAQYINNYWQILEYLKQKFTLSDDDLSDIKGDYDDWIHEFAENVYQQFANYCENVEQYDDRDEFISFIGNQDILFFEMQYIEYLFNDEKRDQYNRFKQTNMTNKQFYEAYKDKISGLDIILDWEEQYLSVSEWRKLIALTYAELMIDLIDDSMNDNCDTIVDNFDNIIKPLLYLARR